ncbi:MAG: flagellar motor switch protein FliG [Paracoccaceae bacterium]
MTELTAFAPKVAQVPATNANATESLTKAQKAAIIIGILGADGAGPLLEQMSENTLRRFAGAMSKLRKVEPEMVHATIKEFLYELDRLDETVNGGLSKAREMLKDYVAEALLTNILDEVDAPSASNVWKKLAVVDEQALAEFLTREHPQTAAVVLSKLSAEQAAQILGRIEAERAREIVFGLTKAATLDQNVIEAIGCSVSEDFLATHKGGGGNFKPAERIGTIMNFTSGEIRQAVLSFLDDTQPELADSVRRSMFTFEDIQDRVEKRDVAAIVRLVEQDELMRALKGAEQNAPATAEFILTSISSRMAEQFREALGEMDKVKIREAEDAQNAVLRTIKEMEATGQLKLSTIEE